MPTWIRRLAPVLLMFVLVAAAASTSAQERLPGEVVRAEGTWTSSQREQVTRHIERWADQMLSGEDPQQIAIARAQLIEPLTRPGSTAAFRDQYSQALVGPLGPGSAPDQPVPVRLNTLIVVGKMAGGYGLDLIIDGLDDPSSAVRYWAGKAAAENLGEDGQSPFDQQALNRLLDAIAPALDREQSWEVREQLYLALAAMPLAEARTALLDALQTRVAHYAAEGLNIGIRAERRAISQLYRTFVTMRIMDRLQDQYVRALVVTAGQYAQLVKEHVQQGGSEALMPVLVEITGWIEQVLRWGVGELSAGEEKPEGPPLTDPLAQGRYPQFALNVLEWVGRTGIAVNADIGITAEELMLPQAPAGG